ncbi:MAG TPA: phosphoglycerate kinase [Candidatus Paceibacterota bacterium]
MNLADMALRTLTSAPSLKGKRVILRTSLNEPVDDQGAVSDLFRLRRGLPTLEYLVREGAKVIVVGYFGRSGESLLPVAEALEKIASPIPIRFTSTPPAKAGVEVAALRSGQCLVLENTRRDPREEKNDEGFSRELAELGDFFVDDAFAEAHRAYASNVGITKFLPSFAGLLLAKEVAELSHALHPPSPSLCIIGGAKFETKGPLIEKFLKNYDQVFVGGAIANDLFKAQGLEVGKSLVSAEPYDFGNILSHPKLLLPKDVVVEGAGPIAVKAPAAVTGSEGIYDVGPQTITDLSSILSKMKFVLWNGPLGNYEHGFIAQTQSLASAIARSGAYSVVGGGDTIAAIATLHLEDRFSFLSTGGGAMLEFLDRGTLPGIEVLIDS